MSPLRDRPEPPLLAQVLAVACVSIAVEIVRIRLHPEVLGKAHILAIAVIVNIAYHIWNMPPDYKRLAASAVLGEASMPVVVVLVTALATAVMSAVVTFLRDFLPNV